MKIVPFASVSLSQWDAWLHQFDDATFVQSARYLDYSHKFLSQGSARSFAFLGTDDQPLALCPLGFSKGIIGDTTVTEVSWNGAPVGVPVFRRLLPSQEQRLRREVMNVYGSMLAEAKAIRCLFRQNPISLGMMNGSNPPTSFAMMMHGYEPQIQNTSVVELRYSESALLERMSKYHRRHLKSSVLRGLTVTGFGGRSVGVDRMFARYQEAHMASAGRLTRAQATFDAMLECVRTDAARLFVAFLGNTPISFLLCGIFNRSAWGWSQANIEEYEKEYSPRHLLEWRAMLELKARGIAYYELGTIWHGAQPYKVPSSKELSIAEFKRRYGGTWYPEVIFERIFDPKLWSDQNSYRAREFTSSAYFSAPPIADEMCGEVLSAK